MNAYDDKTLCVKIESTMLQEMVLEDRIITQVLPKDLQPEQHVIIRKNEVYYYGVVDLPSWTINTRIGPMPIANLSYIGVLHENLQKP